MLTTPWRRNGGAVATHHTFAVGDVHGRASALARLLDHLDDVQPRRAPRELIFLGDLIDRGPESRRAIELAMGAAERCDFHTILPGNHELMLLDALDDPHANFPLWFHNGGSAIFEEHEFDTAGGLPAVLQALRSWLPDGFEETLRTGATHLVRDGILFVHAGLHPAGDRDAFLGAPRTPIPSDGAHWAWIREPFLNWAGGWSHLGLKLVVHGHTPATGQPIVDPKVALDLLDLITPLRRICLDAGAAAGLDQLAALEIDDDRHRLHVAEAPSFLG